MLTLSWSGDGSGTSWPNPLPSGFVPPPADNCVCGKLWKTKNGFF